ncbi:uncharacterized protein LOC111704208 [Eurytemora carolleeae]|uniref:uncharacterized protein LOC111704208 n=1 Tax=Eurytemora carolleeae TaxID=1294199 RepID=UPI000C77F211|nr:uncharacterized protein LOC111704208 [Eurytemora carolleeae]|eukprot:XP_023332129.1 uncharacterized protein LOC111704208 [Eurytemora affinis]
MLIPGSTSLRFLCVNCVKQSSFALQTSFYSKDVRILNKNVWSSSKFSSATKLQNSNFPPNYLSTSSLPIYLPIFSLSNYLPISKRRMSTASPPENGKEKILSDEPVKKDNIITVPNILCVSRIVTAPVLSSLIVQGNFEAACALFMLAGFTDLLDGWIARNFKGQASSLGSFLDPLADKILVCTLYLTLTYVNIIPPSLTGLIVSRDLFLVYAEKKTCSHCSIFQYGSPLIHQDNKIGLFVHQILQSIIIIQTVSVISNDFSFREWHDQLTTMPLKPFFHGFRRYYSSLSANSAENKTLASLDWSWFSFSAHALMLLKLLRSICSTNISPPAPLISSAAASPRSKLLHSIMTLAPLLLNSLAHTFPIPVLAPVITTTLPSNRFLDRHLGPCIQTLKQKYFDVSLPTATVQPTAISKVNTALQFLLISVSLGAPVFNLAGHPSIHYLWALTGATTFLSAVSYAFMKNTYKFSHRPYDHQFGKKLTAFILFVLFNIGFTLTFPSQALKAGPTKECPITGQLSQDCPVIGATDEIDIYSEKSNQYYLNKIRQTRD